MRSLKRSIMGTFTRHPSQYKAPVQQAQQRQGQPNMTVRRMGVSFSFCRQLDGWQRQIVRNLVGGNDVYTVSSPGSGKTLPLICYWTDSLLNLNTMSTQMLPLQYSRINDVLDYSNRNSRQNMRKMLITVPVIVLANQTGQEFREVLTNSIIQVINEIPLNELSADIPFFNTKRISDLLNEINRLHTTHIDSQQRRAEEYTLSDQQSIMNIHLRNSFKLLKEEIIRMCQDSINRAVYVQTGAGSTSGNVNEALVAISILESASSIISKMNNLKMLVIDEAHLIQPSGQVIADDSRSMQMMMHLHRIMQFIKKHNATSNQNTRIGITMLSGTSNPIAAKKVTDHLNQCYNTKFTEEPQSSPASAGNRSKLTIVPNESIATDAGIINNIVRSVERRDWGQLYVLFSTKKITSLARELIDKIGQKDVQSMKSHGHEFQSQFAGLGQHRSQSVDPDSSKMRFGPSEAEQIASLPGIGTDIANVVNPLLRQCLMRGVGFIYRNIPNNPLDDYKEEQMADNDKRIVAKLFKEKKIPVLLATDAVGIGVNIDVKDLYIPNTSKFDKKVGENITMALRELTQILNRAGRGSTPLATIYTTSQNTELVTNALYALPGDFPDVDVHKRKLFGLGQCSEHVLWRVMASPFLKVKDGVLTKS